MMPAGDVAVATPADARPARGTARPPRRRAVRVAGLLVGLLAGLGVVELGLRLFARRLSLAAFAGDEARHRVYRASELLGYEPIPGQDGYNEFGVLDYGYVQPRRERLLRILVLGDSITHRRLWVEMLERRLEDFVGAGGRVELWNAGVEGYNTAQEEAFLRHRGADVRPDAVLVQFHLNDFLPLPVLFEDRAGQIAYMPGEATEFGRFNESLFRASYLYRYLLLRWRPAQAARKEASRRQVERAVLGIRELCRQRRLDLLFVVFPLFKARADYEEAEQLWHRWIVEILGSAGIDFVDLHEAFPADRSIESYREASDDPWHPNLEGHRLAATRVAEALRTRPLVRRAARRSRRAASVLQAPTSR